MTVALMLLSAMLQTSPDSPGHVMQARYDCTLAEYREQARCEISLLIPASPKTGEREAAARYECLYSRSRAARCILRSRPLENPQVRDQVEAWVQDAMETSTLSTWLLDGRIRSLSFTANAALVSPGSDQDAPPND